jgi:urease accessory protein
LGEFVQLRKIETPASMTEPAQAAEPALVGGPMSRPIITHGRAEIAFKAVPHTGEDRLRKPSATLDHLYYRDPMKILFPRAGVDDCATAVLVTTSGGLVGGDRLAFEGCVGRDASAILTVQAAEKVYRSVGPDCEMSVDLVAEDAAWLEWLPQETILFDQARLRRTTKVATNGTGQVLAGEMMVFGRLARGEVFRAGLARDAWDVSVDGRPVWRDALHLEGDVLRVLDHPAAFNGARASATAIFAGKGAEDCLELARDCLEGAAQQGDAVLSAATAMTGVVIVRWLAVEPMRLRRAYGAWWAAFRHQVHGLPARLPRMWEI